MARTKKVTEVSEPTSGGNETISFSEPYRVSVRIRGDADLLFHRWNCESVDAKSSAAKGSKAKKTDDIESYLYKNDEGFICIPTEYVRMAIVGAAKYRADPRSPRKSGMDLFKAGVIPLTNLCSTGKKDPDYLDRRRVVVQRSGINRTRPALRAGWEAEFIFLITLPEYINQEFFLDVLTAAGRLIGLADFRPTFGRFQVIGYKVLKD